MNKKELSPATKFQLISDIYNSGLICNCKNWEKKIIYAPTIDVEDQVLETIIHDDNCSGKERVRELLGFFK